MKKISKYLHGVSLKELFVKSIPKEVGIALKNYVPYRGKVKNIENSSVEIDQAGNGLSTFVRIKIRLTLQTFF